MACKPGSVPRGRSPGWMTIHLGPVSLPASCSQPERRPEIAPVIHCLKTIRQYDRSFLFGFAPGGVYRAPPIAGGPVRSYRTLSPWPTAYMRSVVCFLWHFPWGCPRQALSGTVIPWSPDFPLCSIATDFAKRPSSHLTGLAYRGFCLKVKFLSCQPPCRAVRWVVTHITSTLVETGQNRL